MEEVRKATLHDLTNEYLWTYGLADDEDMENTADEWFDRMFSLDESIEDKYDAYASVITKLTGDASTIKAEEERLAARRKAIENRVKRIKERMQECMEVLDKKQIKTALHTFNIQNNPPVVVLDCEVEDLPKEFIRYASPVADKKNIMAILKTGTDFPFAHLEQSASIRIR